MIIALAADHGGYELKNTIKEHLKGRKAPDGSAFKIADLGTNGPESVDYPLYGKACAEAVAGGKAELGIVCCGTGIGISIAANQVKGISCALCTSVEMAKLCKQHNNANILALGGRTTAPELACQIVDAWLDSEFEGGRHARRIALIDEI
ncbi:MAG: ribose 5-phosphate isomerase B [Clostridia bacterium]|nr:ribose 5-phosphate isomerase B [Clostridia bacterium]